MIEDGRWKSLLPIKRKMLEYPTENVSFAYLDAINKLDLYEAHRSLCICVVDLFTDKAIKNGIAGQIGMPACGRFQDFGNYYWQLHFVGATTADHQLRKTVNSVITILASESIDLTYSYGYVYLFSVSGSTLKGFRSDLTTPKISASDTTFASGLFGVGTNLYNVNGQTAIIGAKLLTPLTQLPPALALIELPVIGKGTNDDPIRPDFATNVRDHPEFGKIDTFAVTWGSFDYKNGETMLCVIKGNNPYNAKAVETQILYAKSKNMIVEKPPKDVQSAEELHVKLKREFSEWLAGKHDFAYQTLGYADLEPLAVADFYDGAMEGYYGKDPFKNVPEWELERTIRLWIERLNRSNVRSELKDNHVKKLKRVLKA